MCWRIKESEGRSYGGRIKGLAALNRMLGKKNQRVLVQKERRVPTYMLLLFLNCAK